jgi:hypothetical protein
LPSVHCVERSSSSQVQNPMLDRVDYLIEHKRENSLCVTLKL